MINNTIHDFLNMYQNQKAITLSDLETYYNKHPFVFEEYFNYHCPKTEERLNRALEAYPEKIGSIQQISEILPGILEEMLDLYNKRFGTNADLSFNLLVGGFGSNAFVERKIIGELYFAAEKLSSDAEHLRVIAAHELGHVFHNILSEKEEMDWSRVQWTDGLFTLYREGIATYLSKELVAGLNEAVYFSYDEEGEEWLDFYIKNFSDIKEKFLQDAESGWNFDKEREWFRLSGGSYFGYNRLGYYLGTSFVQDLVKDVGLSEALIYWCKNDLKAAVIKWLQKKEALKA